MKRLFVDSDVFLDVILDRIEFADDSSKIFDLSSMGLISIFTTSICVANIYYLSCRMIGKQKARKKLLSIKPLFQICSSTNASIEQSLKSNFADLEDAFQYYSALENKMEAIITRNIKDYQHSTIPVLTPTEFLASQA